MDWVALLLCDGILRLALYPPSCDLCVSFEKFCSDEAREMDSAGDPNKQNLGACIALADARFTNEGTLDELYADVRRALA